MRICFSCLRDCKKEYTGNAKNQTYFSADCLIKGLTSKPSKVKGNFSWCRVNDLKLSVTVLRERVKVFNLRVFLRDKILIFWEM